MRENFTMISFVFLSISIVSERSSGRMRQFSLFNPQSFFTLSSSSILLADKTSFAFSFANAFASASPIPEDAPVIQTTLSLKLIDVLQKLQSRGWWRISSVGQLGIKVQTNKTKTNREIRIF